MSETIQNPDTDLTAKRPDPDRVEKWLASLPGVIDTRPLVLTIDGKRFSAVFYRQRHTVKPGCNAYDRGEREYVSERIYICGTMTKNMIRKVMVAGAWENKCLYLMPGDARDWFVAGFIDPVPAHYSTFHPFGSNFILSPWDETHGKIDAHDSPGQSRIRIPVGCTETFPL